MVTCDLAHASQLFRVNGILSNTYAIHTQQSLRRARTHLAQNIRVVDLARCALFSNLSMPAKTRTFATRPPVLQIEKQCPLPICCAAVSLVRF